MLISRRANTILLVLILAAGLGIVAMLASDARGGPLDPPGPPGSTDSVRLPGTPISSLPFVISQPGHYYVTRNLSMPGTDSGIIIQADDVTLDLMGFQLSAGLSLGAAISEGSSSPVRTGWTIRNGALRGWPHNAIWLPNVRDSVFEDLYIEAAGVTPSAPTIWADTGNTVRRVRLRVNSATNGISLGGYARVSDCEVVAGTGGPAKAISVGASSSVSGCTVNGYGYGIVTGGHSEVRDCVVGSQATTSIVTGGGSTITRCNVQVSGAGATGIQIGVGGYSAVTNNVVACVGGAAGIKTFYQDWVDGNEISWCQEGVVATGIGNSVTRNRCQGIMTCVADTAGDDVGPIGTAASLTSPWSNMHN